MALKPGKRTDPDTHPDPNKIFANSMAGAIEKVFEKEWLEKYGYPLPRRGREDRKIFYVAIAQGVVKHLVDNAEASFHVHDVEVQQVNSLITSSGRIDLGYWWGEFDVDVTQDSDPSDPDLNKAKSEGEGKLEIFEEGLFDPWP